MKRKYVAEFKHRRVHDESLSLEAPGAYIISLRDVFSSTFPVSLTSSWRRRPWTIVEFSSDVKVYDTSSV